MLELSAWNKRGRGGIVYERFSQIFEGRLKANEKSMKEKLVHPKINMFLIWFQKINRLFLRNNQLFLSTIIKNQSRTNLNEIRDRKINKIFFILVLSLLRATSSPQLTTENTLTNQHLDYNTHQSGDLEPFKNTHHLRLNTTKFRTPSESAQHQSLQNYKNHMKENGIHPIMIKDQNNLDYSTILFHY